MIKNIENLNEFTEVIKSPELIVMDFYADWCGPCKTMAKVLSKWETNLSIYKVDVDSHSEIGMQFNVKSIPTLIFLKDGKEVDRIIGAVPISKLEQKEKELTAPRQDATVEITGVTMFAKTM